MPESPYNTEDLPEISAGVARSTITPDGRPWLAGYYHERIGETVRDDLHCRALILDDGECRICMITMDLVSINREWADAAREMIVERLGIPADRIIISATHTHTGPSVGQGRPNTPQEWLEDLPGMIADTA
ncbi:MAG: hypothetical protein GF393_09280, partial [Armatimonadia bacterium]|nr:hypothetical protein [Armatimonadia bacterium]